MTTLFDSAQIGKLTLKNRIVMAPLTRMRSKQPGNIPHALNATYYEQRATAGLIISEATQISQQGQGYPGTPGIHTDEQVEGWKLVTKAVHDKGGKIFLQLWHVGRISHSSHQPNGGLPVAPSAIKPNGKVFKADWSMADYETPQALTIEQIKDIVQDFKKAAKNAKLAGFDGVEIHGANGYLIDQFLQTSCNQRNDIYGGSIENRTRFLFEVMDEVLTVWDKDCVGVRLSPYGTFNDMADTHPIELFSAVFAGCNERKIGYVHVIEPRASGAGGADGVNSEAPKTSELFRKHFDGFFISAGGYTPELAKEAMANNLADAIAFGRIYIANPDLPYRIQNSIELNPYNRNTFYGGDEKGYTDYPFAS